MKKEFDQDALLTQAEISEKKRREELNDIEINQAEALANDAIEMAESELAADTIVADAGAIATDASLAASATTATTGLSTTALVGGGLAAVGAGLALSGGSSSSSASGEEAAPAETAPREEPVAPTSETRTISSEEVAAFINQNSANNPFAIQFDGEGENTLILANGNVAPSEGFIVSSAGNLTVTSVGDASGKIFVSTTKNVTANLQSVSDIDITTGFGNDRIILAPNALGEGDVINGGTGFDTLEISGDVSNIIGGTEGATITNIENIKLNSILSFADFDALSGLTIEGDNENSQVIVTANNAEEIDFSEVKVSGLKSLSVETQGDVELTLDDITVAGLQSLEIVAAEGTTAGAISVSGSADAIRSLLVEGKLDSDNTAEINIDDTAANIQALLNDAAFVEALDDASVVIGAGSVSVADALALVASGSDIEFSLKDTAANLATAPSSVFDDSSNIIDIEVTDAASVAQANAIIGLAASTAKVEFSLADSASNLANYTAFGTKKADSITVTDEATIAEATVIVALINDADDLQLEVVDSAVNVSASSLQGIEKITLTDTGALPVSVIEAVIDMYDEAVVSGYKVKGTFTELSADLDSLAGASEITVTDDVTSQQAISVLALEGGSKVYGIVDSVEGFLLASNDVIAAADSVEFVAGEVPSAQQVADLFAIAGDSLSVATVTDSVANLAGLSTDALATVVAFTVATTSVADTATYLSLLANMEVVNTDRAVADHLTLVDAGKLVDSAAELVKEGADAAYTAAAAVELTGSTSFADAIAVEALDMTADIVKFAAISGDFATVKVADVAALEAAFAKSASVEVSNLPVSELPLATAMNGTLVYDLKDTATALSTKTAEMDAARNIVVTGTATVAQAEVISAATNDVDIVDGKEIPNGNTTTFAIAEMDITAFNTSGEPAAAALAALLAEAQSVTVTGGISDLSSNAAAVKTVADAQGTVNATGTAAEIKAAVTDTTDAGKALVANIDSFDVAAATINDVNDDSANNELVADLTAIINSGVEYDIEVTISKTVLLDPTVQNAGFVVENATTVNIASTETLTLDQFESFDSQVATLNAKVEDSLVKILAASDALLALPTSITFTGADVVTAAQAVRLADAGLLNKALLKIEDTAANLQALELNDMGDRGILGVVASVAVSDEGPLVDLSVEDVENIFDDGSSLGDGSFRAEYTIKDKAAAIIAADNATATTVDALDAAANIVVTDVVSAADAVELAVIETLGSVEYSVETTFTAASSSLSALAEAKSVAFGADNMAGDFVVEALDAADITALMAAGVDFSKATYALTFALTSDVFQTVNNELVVIEEKSPALTNAQAVSFAVSLTAEEAQLVLDAGVAAEDFTYNLSDSAANLAAADAALVAGATNVAVTGTATFAQASDIESAFAKPGTLSFNINDKAENFAQASSDSLAAAGTLTIMGAISAAEAATLVAARADLSADTVTISDSAAALAAVDKVVLSAVDSVTPTDAISVELLKSGATFANYKVADTFSNIMQDESVNSSIDALALLNGASEIAVSDAITLAQLNLVDASLTPALKYSVVDSDDNIAAAIKAEMPSRTGELTGADSVTGSAGEALEFITVGKAGSTVFGIVGEKEFLTDLSDDLQSTGLIFKTDVAELNADINFYANLNGDLFIVEDSLANLKSGSLILNRAIDVKVEDAIAFADIAFVEGISAVDSTTYAVEDTAKNLAAAIDNSATALDNASAVTVSTVATYAEAVELSSVTATTVTYSVSDTATAMVANTALSKAVDITVTLAENTTSISAAKAVMILSATNTGVTVLPAVDVQNQSELDFVLAVLTEGESIASITVTDAIAVGNATTGATELQAAVAAGQITSVSYKLVDSGENFANASDAVLNSATSLSATGTVTIAQAARMDAAPAADDATVYAIKDSAAEILAASSAQLARGKGTNNFVAVDDTDGISVADALALNALDAANNGDAGFRIGTLSGASSSTEDRGIYELSDTLANLTNASNASVVSVADAVTVTGQIKVADVASLNSATAASLVSTYVLADTVKALLNNAGTALVAEATAADSIVIDEEVTVAQATLLTDKVSSFDIVDSAANIVTLLADTKSSNATIADAAKALVAKSTLVLNTAANLAEADDLVESGLAYDLKDTAAGLAAEFNSSARGVVTTADAVIASTAATVVEALGSVGTADAGETLGLYTLEKVTFEIVDTFAEIKAGLESVDKAGFSSATTITIAGLDDTTAMNMAVDNIDLSALDNLRGELEFVVNGGAGSDTITLGNGKDIVELAADGTEDSNGNTEVDSVLGFDASEDQIDLLFGLTNGSEDLSALVSSKFGGLVDGKIVSGLTATDIAVTNDGDITDDELATALANVEFTTNDDVAYLLVNATAVESSNTENSVVLLKVEDDASAGDITAAEITQLAVITSADIDGLEVADLTANNFTDFTA